MQCIDTVIPTPSGYKRLGDIKVGDRVFGLDGKSTRVVGIPFDGREKLYRVEFNDGTSTTAGAEHLWICKGSKERFKKGYKNYGKWVVRSIKEIIKEGKYFPQATPTKRFSIPICEPVQYKKKKLLDPYLVGTVFSNKFIPKKFLLGSIEQRKALLRGLFDTDGTCNKKGMASYTTTSHKLALDVHELICSLGGSARIKKRTNTFTVWVKLRFNPFNLDKRNKKLWYQTKKYKHERVIKKITPLRKARARCIEVERRDGSYLTTNNYIVTHNSTTQIRKAIHWATCPDIWPKLWKTKPQQFWYLYPTKDTASIEVRKKWVTEILPTGEFKSHPVFGWHDEIRSRNIFGIHFNSGVSIYFKTYAQDVQHLQSGSCHALFCFSAGHLVETKFGLKRIEEIQIGDFVLTRDGTYQKVYNTMSRIKPVIKRYLSNNEFIEGTPEHKIFTKNRGYVALCELTSEDVLQEKTLQSIHVVSGTPCFSEEKTVYNLSVANNHNYYVSGVSVSNCDEELPEELFDELNMRLAATDGYFHLAFTATLGQEFWREVIEEKETPRFPAALKQQISMYDCIFYEDGSPSLWTEEKINRIKNSCKSDAEVQKRVYGRFVVESGLKYPAFIKKENMLSDHKTPKDWHIYAGVDVGSGGSKAHPAAICFVAVKPDYTTGRVIKTWRGDGITTTASDVLTQFRIMKEDMRLSGQFYDWQAKDFYTISSRVGEPFSPAEKNHEIGEQIVNVLFKNKMLYIYDTPDNDKLVRELMSLRKDISKTAAKDDLCDALRYSVTKIPWDYSVISGEKEIIIKPKKTEIELRRELVMGSNNFVDEFTVENELQEWIDWLGV